MPPSPNEAVRRREDRRREQEREENFFSWGSPQPIERAHFRQGNQRESRSFSLTLFGHAWLGFGGFGYICDRLGLPPILQEMSDNEPPRRCQPQNGSDRGVRLFPPRETSPSNSPPTPDQLTWSCFRPPD
jgi:hypothetical protein